MIPGTAGSGIDPGQWHGLSMPGVFQRQQAGNGAMFIFGLDRAVDIGRIDAAIGGNRHLLPDPFYVLATRNPIEQEGTYPLPEGQLDRFLMLVQIDYPSREEEVELVRRTTGVAPATVSSVIDRETLAECRRTIRQIPVADPLLEQAIMLVRATRPVDPLAPDWAKPLIEYGGGPRAAQALVLVAKALAGLDGRPCVGLEDLQRAARPVLRHRLVLSPTAAADGITADELVERLLAQLPGHGGAS